MVQTASFTELTRGPVQQIESALDGYTRLPPACPARLAEAVRYSLLGGGKRLRPWLVLMSAEACGCDYQQALPAACAVEMIHTYSLIHDDLPAMDDDDLRRGRPTCHKVYGEAMAILAGDALLTLAFEVIAKHTKPPETAARCCAALAEAAGAIGMVGGQVDDLKRQSDFGAVLIELREQRIRRAGHDRARRHRGANQRARLPRMHVA